MSVLQAERPVVCIMWCCLWLCQSNAACVGFLDCFAALLFSLQSQGPSVNQDRGSFEINTPELQPRTVLRNWEWVTLLPEWLRSELKTAGSLPMNI